MKRAAPVLVLLLVTLVAGPARSTPAEPAPSGLIRYVVRPGDSCWSIARERFGDGGKYTVIHRHNALGPMPHLLVPGQVILLPGDSASPEARVGAPRHDVRARPPALPDWREAYEDMALWRLYRVATGDESSALIRFRDASDLRMRSRALLVVHGASARRARLVASAKTVVELEKGTLRGGLARLDREAGGREAGGPGAPARADGEGIGIETPQGEVLVRATDAQIEVVPDEASIVCVYEGEADVRAERETVTVPQEFGTRVDQGEPPQKPRPLPPRPRWMGSAEDAVVLAPEGYPGVWEADWEPVANAVRYRFELARDARFHYPLVDAEVGAGVRAFRAEDLAPGEYHVRVAAIDGDRLEGLPSHPRRLTVLPLEGSRRLERDESGTYEVVGFVRLSVPEGSAEALEIAVDAGPFRPSGEPLRLLEPGVHVVRYRRADGAQVRDERVRVLAVRADVVLPESPLVPGAPPSPLELAIVDERGRPASLPDVTLLAEPGGALPLVPAGPGRYQATLPAPPDEHAGGPIRLTTAWRFGLLATNEVPVLTRERPAPAELPPFRWPDAPATLETATQAPGAPSVGPWPVTHLGLTTTVADPPGGSGDDDPFLRAALRGTMALLDGRVGLDLDLPWYDGQPGTGDLYRQPLGDLRVGARWRVVGDGTLALTPTVRFTLPTGGFPRERDAFLAEPGFAFGWRPASVVTLTSTQLLVVDAAPSAETGLAWASTVSVGVRPWDLVSLTGEFGALVGLTGYAPFADRRALVAGGALRFHVGRVRLSLTGGAGLNDDGRAVFGRFTAGFAFDVGFGAGVSR